MSEIDQMREKAQAIREFLDWLQTEAGYTLVPICGHKRHAIEDLLARYLGAIAEEKLAPYRGL